MPDYIEVTETNAYSCLNNIWRVLLNSAMASNIICE